jgi:hypothetical protein
MRHALAAAWTTDNAGHQPSAAGSSIGELQLTAPASAVEIST